jgi:FtsP/CotA-like multicopper oxidase with cupredoxin domain
MNGGRMIDRRSFLALACGLPAAFLPGAAATGPRLVRRRLRAVRARRLLLGREVEAMLYDGRLPGPVLELEEGDRLELQFENALAEPTNLHFHGMRIPPTGRADNVFLEIPPGERFTYAFDIPEGEAGTYWYHPHHHGAIARQLWSGLAGAIVVRGPVDRMPELAGCDERVVVLRDIDFDDAGLAEHTPNDWHKGKEGRFLLANGTFEPAWRMRAGTARLRLINASNARYLRLALSDRRPFFLIATDGHFLEKPVDLDELLLTPAQRADILVPFEDGRDIDLLALHYNRGAPTPRLVNRYVLRLRPPPGARPLPLPERLVEVPRPDPREVAVRREVTMAMFLVNGRAYRHDRVDASARFGDLELWRIANVGTMDHNFHMHTWYFQVATVNGRPPPFRAWHDTVNLRPGEVVELLVPFVRETGRSVFHCHVAEHGDRGMMGNIEVREGDRAAVPVSPIGLAPEAEICRVR